MQTENQIRAEIVAVGLRLWQRGLVSANDGNITVRVSNDRVLCTPSGASLGFLQPNDLVLADIKGEEPGRPVRGRRPTTELFTHLAVYELRPDVRAVVHAHPPVATAFAAAGMALDQCLLPEAALVLGAVPLAPYGTPGTREVVDSIRSLVPRCDAILMAKHGAITYGPSLTEAHYKMETLEHSAQVAFHARLLGRPTPLTADELEKLEQLKNRYGLTYRTLPCQVNGSCPAAPAPQTSPGTFPGAPTSEDPSARALGLEELVERAVEAVLKRLQH